MGRSAGGHFFTQGLAHAAQRGNEHAGVRQLDIGQRRLRRITPVQRITDPADQQAVFDGVQTLGALRVPSAHLVLAAVAVRKVSGLAHVVNALHNARNARDVRRECCWTSPGRVSYFRVR